MKKTILILAWLAFTSSSFAQSTSSKVSIVPEPVQVEVAHGSFRLPLHPSLEAPHAHGVDISVQVLKDHIAHATGRNLTVSSTNPAASIRLILNHKPEALLDSEGYRLVVSPTQITIRANKPNGLFYGVQSLLQLFPPQIESDSVVQTTAWTAPCVRILDYPRFGWRGLMFDVARHFFGKQDVEAYIDQMAKYKFNVFHWHLTDDEGWRIQIKGLPNLTDKGAWNVKRVGYFGTFSKPGPNEPRNYGGFYTQQDIRDIVAYARKRFVNILPEVDVPGHSLAAVVSYPDLSCTPGADTYQVRSGEPIMDWSHGAPPIALIDNTLCPANEKVYTFLDTVFTQIAQLFPFPYIHVGGDECPKNFWEKSPEIKALMAREGLKTMPEVQSYFEKRVEKIIESKGKKVIGWDEILEGGLAPDAAVMSWRGMQGGIAAARMGHDVVMSPTTYAYLDYMQGDPIIEPHVYATLRLSKAYQFDPMPDSVNPKYILGGQANLWTEQVYTMRHAEYMTWPRAFAISECLWTPKAEKNWPDFVRRVEVQFKRYDVEQVKYAPSMYDPIFKVRKDATGQMQILLSTEIPGLDIHYSWDNSFPDQFYPTYSGPMYVPKEAVMLKVITYRGQHPVGRMIDMPVSELQQRLK